ncbi:hypothetical protein BpHYR1_033858, partial [Brachionus plicatilis]
HHKSASLPVLAYALGCADWHSVFDPSALLQGWRSMLLVYGLTLLSPICLPQLVYPAPSPQPRDSEMQSGVVVALPRTTSSDLLYWSFCPIWLRSAWPKFKETIPSSTAVCLPIKF